MKKKLLKGIKWWLVMIPLICQVPFNASAQSQGFVVTGKVSTEPGGETLPGVSILIKGTTQGTITDVNGYYSIQVPDGQAILIYSFVGYTTQEILVGSQRVIDVRLAEDITSLNEVVVIGYQTVRKRDVTGAVQRVDATEISKTTAASLAESIQGLSPGVSVRNSGGPGDGASIDIRGVASFTNTNPLYVIDGMIADANPTINTNDIASVQILKDASAAAIYGSRAANGVIIITTKHGEEGATKVSASAKYGIQQIAKQYDVMDANEFAAMQRQQYENSGETPPASVQGTPEYNTDWQDEVMQTGNMQDYNITLSGGSKTSNYLISGSYYKNEGVLTGNSFDRASLRINTKSNIGRVTFGENLLLSNSRDKQPDQGNPFYDAPQMLPVIPVQNESYITDTNPMGYGIGTLNAVTYAWNPIAVNALNPGKSNYSKIVGNAYVDVEIFDWLNYKFNVGLEGSFDYSQTIRKDGVWSYNAAVYPSKIDESRSTFSSFLYEHTLNFNKTFGKHNINGVVGISQQELKREFTSAGRSDLLMSGNNYFTTIGSASGEAVADGGASMHNKILGYLGRVNYTYDDRYILTLTGRIDQDSRFGDNYRTGYFPSVAAAWRISSEDFFEVSWVSDLKLKASYGELGINPLGSWDYTAFINTNPRAIFGVDQNVNVGSVQAKLANEDLKWEERTVKNIGIEASLLDNNLSISFEAYNSLSDDCILALPVGGYLGNLGGYPNVNAGSIRNTGIEVALTYRDYDSDIKWDASVNFTTIHNEVESVGDRGEGIDYIQQGNTRTKVGRSVGEWYLIKTDGIFQNQGEIDAYVGDNGLVQPNAKPGDIRYVDADGDGDIDADDRQFAGSPWPKLQAGAQFNVSYKQFSLNMQFVGVFGNKVYNDVKRILDSYQNTNFRSDLSPWSSENTGTDDPRIGLATDQGIIENNWGNTDRWLESGSYLRLRNIQLAYGLPKGTLNKAGINNAKIYISGQNLFTITDYSGLDPDVVGANLLERGLDNGNWPASRVYSIGIQFDF